MRRELPGSEFSPARLPDARVAVLFTADWCGYCHRFLPHFRREAPGGWVVDVSDEDDPAWDAYAIRVVPTVVVFEAGRPVGRWAGALGPRDAAAVRAALENGAGP